MKTLFLDLYAVMHGRGPEISGWKTAALISLIMERTGARLVIINASLGDYGKYYLVKELPYDEWEGEGVRVQDYVAANGVDDYFVIKPEDESWRQEWHEELQEAPTKEEWQLKLGKLLETFREDSEADQRHIQVCPCKGLQWEDANKIIAQWE